nr:hypothetical protein [Acidobacteriota bacterium]
VAEAYPTFSDPRALSYPQGYYGTQGDYGAQGDYGSGFGSGVNIGGLFSGLLSAAGTIGSGLLGSGTGFGIWGWVLNWFTHSLSLNGSFFSGLGYHNDGGYGGGFSGRAAWNHNPAHRLGVPYSHGFVSARYRGGDFGGRSNSWRSGFANSGRSGSDGWHRPGFGGSGGSAYRSGFAGGTRENYRGSAMAGSFRGSAGFDRTPRQAGSERFNAMNFAGSRAASSSSGKHFSSSHFSAPREEARFSAPHFSASRSTPHFSAPHGSSYSGGGHFGGGHSGGGHSGGGHSGKGSHKH